MKRKKINRKRKNGFTIIEVLIVLLIAGFILTVVFLAVPATQRSKRNYQRRQDVSTLLAAIKEYENTYDKLPASCNNKDDSSCFLRSVKLTYYDNTSDSMNVTSFYNRSSAYDSSSDPHLDAYDITSRERVSIRSYAKCDGNQLTGTGALPLNIAAEFVIETGANEALQCLEAS